MRIHTYIHTHKISELLSLRTSNVACPPKAGEIFEDEQKDDGDDNSITDWLNDIKAKDEQLRKVQQDQARGAEGGATPAPVRNAGNKKVKNVQVGMSDVEKEKATKKKGKEVGEDGVPKHQKYYQYDYFKEWWAPRKQPCVRRSEIMGGVVPSILAPATCQRSASIAFLSRQFFFGPKPSNPPEPDPLKTRGPPN